MHANPIWPKGRTDAWKSYTFCLIPRRVTDSVIVFFDYFLGQQQSSIPVTCSKQCMIFSFQKYNYNVYIVYICIYRGWMLWTKDLMKKSKTKNQMWWIWKWNHQQQQNALKMLFLHWRFDPFVMLNTLFHHARCLSGEILMTKRLL